MINRAGQPKDKIPQPKATPKTLSEIQDRLGELALREEKDFDGKEIIVMSDCYKELTLMDVLLFDADDMSFKNELLKFILKLEEKYCQKTMDVSKKSYNSSLDDEPSSDEDLVYPDFDLGSRNEICGLEEVTDSDCEFDAQFYYGEDETCQPQRAKVWTLKRAESSVFNSEKSALSMYSHFSKKEEVMDPAKLADLHGILMVDCKM